MPKVKLALCGGDYNGIGPEIIIKSLCDPGIQSLCEFIIFGSEEIFHKTFKLFDKSKQDQFSGGLDFVLANMSEFNRGLSIDISGFSPGVPDVKSGFAAYNILSAAIDFRKLDGCLGIVTAPVMKRTFFPEDVNFNGQTEWIADRTGGSEPLMVLVSGGLRVALVTTHLAIKDITGFISIEAVFRKGRLFFESLRDDFGIDRPKIALCSLNPHGGESGRFGDEEREVLEPAMDELRKSGGKWSGPFPADSLFSGQNMLNYDGILAMYHDQGLIPFKMYSNRKGVNFTAGLPVVRTSPDHGTAMDIAGKGIADEQGFKEAIKLAEQVAARRYIRG